MGNKNIRKEEKKKKKVSSNSTATPALKSIVSQPELVKRTKK